MLGLRLVFDSPSSSRPLSSLLRPSPIFRFSRLSLRFSRSSLRFSRSFLCFPSFGPFESGPHLFLESEGFLLWLTSTSGHSAGEESNLFGKVRKDYINNLQKRRQYLTKNSYHLILSRLFVDIVISSGAATFGRHGRNGRTLVS